jgi:hypothetical protein
MAFPGEKPRTAGQMALNENAGKYKYLCTIYSCVMFDQRDQNNA